MHCCSTNQQSLSNVTTCAATCHHTSHTPYAMLQYNPAPGSHGSVKFLYARIADIFMGTIITSLFTLVLPWSVPPPHHSLHSLPPPAFNTCLQQFPSAVPPFTFSSLSALDIHATCLQQLLHLTLTLPSVAFNSPCTCLLQFPHLPSLVPALAPNSLCTRPSQVSLLALSSPSCCL